MTTNRKRPGIKAELLAAKGIQVIAGLFSRGYSLSEICRHLESEAMPIPGV
jgi:hypothetical protein